MAESHVISALTSKHAELSGQIKRHQTEIDKLQIELDHLDATIKLFDPDYDLRGIRPRIKREQNPWFSHGELNRLILDMMRQAKSTVTVRGVFDAIAQRKGFDTESIDSKAIQKAIDKRLRALEKDGTATKAGIEVGSGANLWQLR